MAYLYCMEKPKETPEVRIAQSVAILIDGNNIERSLHKLTGDKTAMLNFDSVIPKLLDGRGLTRLIYFAKGLVSQKNLLNGSTFIITDLSCPVINRLIFR